MSKFNLSLEQFLHHAQPGRVVPLIQEIFAGDETPVGLYEKLSLGKSGTFLLESAEHGVWSRYSFIGVQSRTSLRQSDSVLHVVEPGAVLPNSQSLAQDSLAAISQIQGA